MLRKKAPPGRGEVFPPKRIFASMNVDLQTSQVPLAASVIA